MMTNERFGIGYVVPHLSISYGHYILMCGFVDISQGCWF